jgi:hypothetical protein
MKMKRLRGLLLFSWLHIVGLSIQVAHAQSVIDGTWHASFQVMGTPMLMDIDIQLAAGAASYLINPDHPDKKVTLQKVAFINDSLAFEWPAGNLSFKGKHFPAGDSIAGIMRQSGLSWPVTFSREVRQLLVAERPQKPTAPFPYSSREVVYRNLKDSTLIYGTLTYPVDSSGNYPVVILASGSGPQDRNCSLLGHEPFLLLADQLARNGIATLRFDDRGTGASKAAYSKASLNDFGNDAAAGIAFIRTQTELKGHPVGLMGHSEGGMHILLAQKQFPKNVDFMVFLSSIGVTGKEVLVRQQYEIPLKAAKSEAVARWNSEVFKGMSDIVLAQKDQKKASEELGDFLRKAYKSAPEGAVEGMNEMQFVMGNAAFLNNNWARQFLAFDAAAYLKKYRNPALVVLGEKDIQVDAETNLAAFKEALAKNPAVAYVVIPGANHLLQTCKDCTVTEYGELTQTMDPRAIATIISFINGLR